MSDKCPITGMPCSHIKCIHISDIKSDYTVENSCDLCQVCGAGMLDKWPGAEAKNNPVQVIAATAVQGLMDFLGFILQKPASKPAPQKVMVNTKPPCSSCGCVIADILKTSRLGCPKCYDHFRDELLPVLIHIQKSTEHIGKRPKNKHKTLDHEEQLKILNLKLKQAIDQEQYEEAAKIRDEVKGLLF